MENLYYLERVKKVIDFLNSNPNKDVTLKQAATIAMFSEFHFHRIFKNATGATLRQYIKQLRMEKAGACLENDDRISIKELWSQLGYCTASNFSRDFRRFYGCSPSQYQKKLKESRTKKQSRRSTRSNAGQPATMASRILD